MDDKFIRERLTELRMQKNVSEYKMSLDLGHSKSYIQSIVSGRSMPSMTEFLYICDYLGTTPKDFFDPGNRHPLLIEQALSGLHRLTEKDLELVLSVINRLTEKHGKGA